MLKLIVYLLILFQFCRARPDSEKMNICEHHWKSIHENPRRFLRVRMTCSTSTKWRPFWLLFNQNCSRKSLPAPRWSALALSGKATWKSIQQTTNKEKWAQSQRRWYGIASLAGCFNPSIGNNATSRYFKLKFQILVKEVAAEHTAHIQMEVLYPSSNCI